MIIEYKDSKRIVALSTESLLTSSDYTSSNFTTVGSTVAITNNSVVFSSTPTNADNGQYEQITALAESDSYTLDFKLNVSSHATFDNYYLALTNTSGAINSANQLGLQTQGGSYNRFTFSTRISGSSSETASSNGTVSTGTDYYCTLSSDGTTATFKAWTNSGRTGTASVTLTRPVSGLGTLNYIQHRSRNSGDSNTWSGTVSEVALSRTPAKPTNVQDNSILVEKDTARRYWFSEATPTTYETDFSSDPTISSNDTNNNYYDSTNDRWYIQWDWNNSNDSGSIDLYSKIGNQNLSDDDWVVRFKYTIVSQNFTTGSDSKQFFIGLTSTDYSNGFWYPDSSNVSTNFGLYMNKSGTYQLYTNDNSAYGSGTWTNTSRSLSNETIYVELIRENSTTAKMNLYSDSSYSTLLVTVSLTIASGLTGLRYLSVKGMRYNSGASVVSNMDDLEIYNGVASATPDTWINEFGISDGLMFGGVSTSTYANFSDSQSWNGTAWTAGGSLTGARQKGASAGTGSTSARYVNGYNSTPAPYPNSNRNESYNGTAWASDTVHPETVNNKENGGCGTADSMIVTGGHKNGTGDVNNYYKWTGSWTSIAQGITGSGGSISGTLTSALMTKSTSAQTWNGSSWTSSSATLTSRTFAPASGTSSTSGFRVFGTYANPFISTSESWNGTAWTARGSAPAGRVEAGCIPASTDSMMTLGGQQYHGASGSALYSTDVYEYRKGTFTTGASFTDGRRGSGGAGS